MVNAVLSGILLSVGWPVLCYCGSEIIRMSLPGSTLSTNLVAVTTVVPYLALFVPFLNYCPADAISSLVTDGGRYYEATSGASYSYAISPWVVIWWCVFTALLLAMAILVYRRRKSECAENHFSYPALRTVIRFLVSAAFGLGCGMVFGQLLNRNWVFFLAVLVGSAVAHGVTQIIWAKGLPPVSGESACLRRPAGLPVRILRDSGHRRPGLCGPHPRPHPGGERQRGAARILLWRLDGELSGEVRRH